MQTTDIYFITTFNDYELWRGTLWRLGSYFEPAHRIAATNDRRRDTSDNDTPARRHIILINIISPVDTFVLTHYDVKRAYKQHHPPFPGITRCYADEAFASCT
ncbi:hypothetical protein MN608_06050 [Microdochium nivale]|nr:hypothetical protein MN608_06050 [Microdochium nivale]